MTNKKPPSTGNAKSSASTDKSEAQTEADQTKADFIFAPEATRLLLVDDHTMLREGLSRSLSSIGFQICGQASDGQDAIAQFNELSPDIVLMDVTMPVLDGIQSTRRLVDEFNARVVMLTMHADASMVIAAKQSGARGYLVKDCSTSDIVEAIKTCLAGGLVFPPPPENTNSENQRPVLTDREVEVLAQFATGKSSAEVASALFVSNKTIKNHLTSIYSKLQTSDRTQALLRASRLGLIRLQDVD